MKYNINKTNKIKKPIKSNIFWKDKINMYIITNKSIVRICWKNIKFFKTFILAITVNCLLAM